MAEQPYIFMLPTQIEMEDLKTVRAGWVAFKIDRMNGFLPFDQFKPGQTQDLGLAVALAAGLDSEQVLQDAQQMLESLEEDAHT